MRENRVEVRAELQVVAERAKNAAVPAADADNACACVTYSHEGEGGTNVTASSGRMEGQGAEAAAPWKLRREEGGSATEEYHLVRCGPARNFTGMFQVSLLTDAQLRSHQ